MITTVNDEKIKNIKKIVDDIASRKAEKLILEAQRLAGSEIKKQKKLLESEINLKLKQAEAEAEKTKKQEVLECEAIKKKNLIAQRDSVAQRTFAELELKLEEYVSSPEYIKNEKEKLASLKSMFADKDTIVFVKNADVDKFKKIVEEVFEVKVQVKADDKIRFGGFVLKNENKKLSVDLLLDTALEEEKKQFFSFAGLAIV
ncbi:MAG: hypothetical protein IJC97_04040 [Oscillospiraceae bacterium]|nr:hypothetical protein [Oscillospiraceae bacterium]